MYAAILGNLKFKTALQNLPNIVCSGRASPRSVDSRAPNETGEAAARWLRFTRFTNSQRVQIFLSPSSLNTNVTS
jgi:hypothetical protein